MFLAQTILLLFLFLIIIVVIIVNINDGFRIESQFKEFIKKYNKSYEPNSAEYSIRFMYFKKSLESIQHLNSFRSHSESAKFGTTKFSDLSPIEFKREYLKKTLPTILKSQHKHTVIRLRNDKDAYYTETKSLSKRHLDGLPDRIDWREKGVISRVHSQGLCGSCWAFSVIETVESMVAIRKNYSTVEPLSVQQIIDCAENNNFGCDGGDTCNLLEWLYEQQIPIEKMLNYPMSGKKQNSCQMSDSLETDNKNGTVLVKNYTCDSLAKKENVILQYLTNIGPLVAGINAQLWQNYLGGVIQFHCDSEYEHLNHAVQIVGFDRTGDLPYYIVRNSWGENFGDNGYVKIEIGQNLCGIANQISTVDVTLV